jgi:hypothetical protein
VGPQTPSRIDDVLNNLAPDNSFLRRVPHPELTARHMGGGDNLKIGHRHEVANFQLALAHDCQGRRLHPTNPDYAPGPSVQNDCRNRREIDLAKIGLKKTNLRVRSFESSQIVIKLTSLSG